jgi:hypothetical protein
LTTDYDHFDAPPLDDPPEFKPGFATPNDYVLKLANAIDRLASVLERLSISPGAPQTPAQASPSGPPPGPPAAAPGGPVNDTQIKRGKKIYAICRQNEWDIADIGQRVTNHPVNAHSQKWAEADQIAVLDAFKEWGVG